MRYTDPSGHSVDPAKICSWCDKELVDIDGWSDLAVGLAQVGCFFAGCHVDTEAQVIRGPTSEEYASTFGLDFVNPMSVAGKPLAQGAKGVVSKYTSKFSQAIEDFIQKAMKRNGGISFGHYWRGWSMAGNVDTGIANNLLIYHTDDAVEGILKIGSSEINGVSALRLYDIETLGGEASMALLKTAAQESVDRGFNGRMYGYYATERGRNLAIRAGAIVDDATKTVYYNEEAAKALLGN